MTNSYRWAWFALACVVAAAWLWMQRYEYVECLTTERMHGCVVVNRWTGRIGIRASTVGRMSVFRDKHGQDSIRIERGLRRLEP